MNYLNTFQFQYGTIKGQGCLAVPPPKQRFNSSMVRLRVYTVSFVQLLNMFQFQYGTIKGVFTAISFKVLEVSIPVWYD